MKFVSKEAQTSNIIAVILNSTQQPGRVFMTSFRRRIFVQMASEEPFDYYSGLWLLLTHIILSQTCSKLRNNSIEDSEVDNRLEKRNRFCWPCEGCQVHCRFFSFPPLSSRTEWRLINTVWLPRHFQNGGVRSRSFKTSFFRIVGTSEAETSVSGKAECLLAIGEDKKVSFLEWPPPLSLQWSSLAVTKFKRENGECFFF